MWFRGKLPNQSAIIMINMSYGIDSGRQSRINKYLNPLLLSKQIEASFQVSSKRRDKNRTKFKVTQAILKFTIIISLCFSQTTIQKFLI